jgi:hypothetical protein
MSERELFCDLVEDHHDPRDQQQRDVEA